MRIIVRGIVQGISDDLPNKRVTLPNRQWKNIARGNRKLVFAPWNELALSNDPAVVLQLILTKVTRMGHGESQFLLACIRRFTFRRNRV